MTSERASPFSLTTRPCLVPNQIGDNSPRTGRVSPRRPSRCRTRIISWLRGVSEAGGLGRDELPRGLKVESRSASCLLSLSTAAVSLAIVSLSFAMSGAVGAAVGNGGTDVGVDAGIGSGGLGGPGDNADGSIDVGGIDVPEITNLALIRALRRGPLSLSPAWRRPSSTPLARFYNQSLANGCGFQ